MELNEQKKVDQSIKISLFQIYTCTGLKKAIIDQKTNKKVFEKMNL